MKSLPAFFIFSLMTQLALAEVELHITSPTSQAIVNSPVSVKFKVSGIDPLKLAKEGHLHLIIDKPLPLQDETIPANTNYLHLSTTQPSVELELSSGEHSLQLLLGNHHHTPHKDNIHSDVITIKVVE